MTIGPVTGILFDVLRMCDKTVVKKLAIVIFSSQNVRITILKMDLFYF